MDLGISDKWSRFSNRFRNSNQIIIIIKKRERNKKAPPQPPFRMSLFNESLCSFDAAEVDVKKKKNLHSFFFFF